MGIGGPGWTHADIDRDNEPAEEPRSSKKIRGNKRLVEPLPALRLATRSKAQL